MLVNSPTWLSALSTLQCFINWLIVIFELKIFGHMSVITFDNQICANLLASKGTCTHVHGSYTKELLHFKNHIVPYFSLDANLHWLHKGNNLQSKYSNQIKSYFVRNKNTYFKKWSYLWAYDTCEKTAIHTWRHNVIILKRHISQWNS